MSATDRPATVSFDPGTGILPAPLEELWSSTDEPGHLLILTAGGGEERSDWTARAAIALAAARAAEGGQVLLADFGLDSPSLHEKLEEENLEGVADIFHFGASLRSVARMVPEAGLLFLPPGAYVPDALEILADPVWDQILTQLIEEGTSLLAFLPVETPGAELFARRFERVVVLAPEGEADALVDGIEGVGGEFTFILTPSPPLDSEPALDLNGWAGGGGEGAGEELEAPLLTAAAVASNSQPAEAEGAESTEEPSPEPSRESKSGSGNGRLGLLLHEPPPVPRGGKKGRRRVSPVLWILLLVAAVAGGWTILDARDLLPDWARLPGQSTEEDSPAEVVAAVPMNSAEPSEADDSAEPVETPLPYSVAVEAHHDFATALDRVRTLRRGESDYTFYVSPIENQGVVYYRVLAGPAADSAGAVKLMDQLVEKHQKSDRDPWSIRPTVWAYDLGEYDSREAAEARVEELEAQLIPAYVVEVEYTDRSSRYRVYVGAFEGPAPAEMIAPRLQEAGIEAGLERRYGKPGR